jgi:hypothetical protein
METLMGSALPITIRTNEERNAVERFLSRYPEYKGLPHEVLLQYADTRARIRGEDDLEPELDGAYDDERNILTSDER